MDSYEDLLNRVAERELASLERHKEEQQLYENVAKQAHKVRMLGRLLLNSPIPSWEDLCNSSQRHLIADAENVAKNPAISGAEINKLYQERLKASGDTDNPDLGVPQQSYQAIEEMVLENLKATLRSYQKIK